MEILTRESNDPTEDWKMAASLFQDSIIGTQEFENIESPNASVDSIRIRSILVPHDPNEDEATNRRRQETYIEKLRDIGTNIKYNIETFGQGIWKPAGASYDKAYLLGKEYKINESEEEENSLFKVERDFSKIIWFSYRKNFPKLDHQELQRYESYISDTGWGCMIRACQMALAQGLRRSLMGKSIIKQNVDHDIISLFLDSETDPTLAPYSIQTISKYLYDKFGLKPGTWLKPSSVLLSLDQIQQEYGEQTSIPDFQIEVFLEGTIYINNILKKVTTEKQPSEEEEPAKVIYENEFEVVEEETKSREDSDAENSDYEANMAISNKNLKFFDTSCYESLLECANKDAVKEMERLLKLKWKSSLMLVVLAKIGLDKPNPEYFSFIKELLSYPESLGMIGGKPGLAYYIVGFAQDKLLYLDPHFVQESVQTKKDLKAQINTYYSQARYLKFSEIDSSIAMTFFIRDENHFKAFVQKFKASCQQNDSFLGIEVSTPRDDLSDFESVGEEDDFEMVGYK